MAGRGRGMSGWPHFPRLENRDGPITALINMTKRLYTRHVPSTGTDGAGGCTRGTVALSREAVAAPCAKDGDCINGTCFNGHCRFGVGDGGSQGNGGGKPPKKNKGHDGSPNAKSDAER
jgi:hypothetical protein